MKIGALARATGTNPPTIRYYEDIGLLPLPDRTGGQRRYGEDDVRRVTFVRRCRDFGFPATLAHARDVLADRRLFALDETA